jgi:2-polyprenyl-3-methyl-5-hydroxy-6-metoxy-1,4-benzoquinol methylase
MTCLFCRSNNIANSFLPDTVFNGKEFTYVQCKQCNLIFVDPIPNDKDLMAMYPPSYQQLVEKKIVNPQKKLAGLRFAYNLHFDLIKKHIPSDKILCDFGCGTGSFVFNAFHNNIKMDGVEFNPDFVVQLKASSSQLSFYTINDFYTDAKKYDLIRLSNVFEHFTNPEEMTKSIWNKLNDDGFVMIEGPLENNSSLALTYKKFYFSLKKKFSSNSKSNHSPTHIVYTNRKNQLEFFKSLGFEMVEYKISEFPWPFPEYLNQVNSLKQYFMFIFGKLSRVISAIVPGWGNTFLYLGKKVK